LAGEERRDVDDGRSAWVVIFDGSPPRRLEACADVCLGHSPMFYRRECNWKKGVLCAGAL
jgi:hypothetical protein